MEADTRIEAQMKLITRRTRLIRILKWYALGSAPLQFVLFLVLARRADRTGEPPWLAATILLESLMLVGAGIALHFIKALFEAVAVVLDELRTTV
jgi:hypothetical protein